uniref:Proline rich 12b n=1 Tax=Oryzias latipes TaxID=8090 RepID=A0A3P9L822_ORYLA
MDRNFPAAGFGELGAGAGWTYDRKPSLMYGSSRSSHPDSELLHRQAYAPPHPLQGYSTNHHPGRQGLFDASLHHAGPSAPDPSVMNLISALDSRGPQSAPPASSLLSQFRNPSWQTGMHTPAPSDLFIAGTLPGSSSFPSSSALSAYQPPSSFSGRSFTPSLSLQDAPTYSPSSSSLLSPHDSLLHIKTPSQSSLGFDRLLPSQTAAYRGSHEPSVPPHAQTPSSSSSCHLPSPKFNLLSSHLHNRSSQLYNTSMFSSSPGLPPAPSSQPQTPSEMAISRHDSVIKHYQRSSPAQSSALQQYASYGGSSEYHQAVSHHRHAGVSCSPLGEQSPPTDPKLSPQMESQTYSPIIPTPYSSSSSGHSASSLSVTKGNKSSSSTSGYSSSGSASSSSQNPHTPPSASSTSSSCSSSSKTSKNSFSVPSCQQLPSQSATAPPPQSGVSSTLMQHTAAKQCLSSHASQSVAKSGASLSDSTPPQHHSQPYSPNQPPSTHITQPYRDFSSPHTQDMSTTAGSSGGKVFTGVPPGGRSFSAEIIYEDSSFGSTSLKRSSSPSLGYGSESAGSGHASSVAAHSSGVGSAGSGSGAASIGNESNGSFHPPDCSTSPSVTSALTHPALPSPAANECLSQSPGAPGSAKYLPPILSSAFMSSPQGFQNPSQTYHSTPTTPKTETNLLAIDRSRDEEESSDFLIHHLLNTQSSSPHLSQLHSRPQQLPQSLSQSRYGEGKGMTYDLEKASDEHYHAQSVIRTGNATSSSGPETSTCDTASVSNRHLETSQMKQQTKIGLAIPNSTAGVLRGAEPVSHSQHNELGSVVHYGRGDLYAQHSHSQHSHHTSHISSHSQQHTQHPQQISQHSQHSQQSLSGSHSPSSSCTVTWPPRSTNTHSPPDDTCSDVSPSPPPNSSKHGDPPTNPLSHSQVDQLKQHQFDSMTVADKVGPHQGQQQRYPPMTSICFPDSLLQDEGRAFFPEMEDIFCSSEFKSSCVGDCRAGQIGRDSLSQARQCVKSGGTGEDYGVVGSPSDQSYGQYCHNMLGQGAGNLHLDLDSLKTHELPSTVNTEQLGLIQSQTPTLGLGSGESSVSKMMGAVGGSSNTSGLTSPIFCSTRPKKLLKTSSFHLLKQRREPQPQTKKNYAQEYEFEDDEDKADVPADIRLNTRRLPDLLPDLVSSCRRGGGASGVSGYSSLGNPPQLPPHDGPKKRGRKPTKPKREGPPRPRGRPRIRPLPEPPYCRGLTGSVAGETRRGRGRGRGRGRREEGLVKTHRDVNKTQSLPYNHQQQQQFNSQAEDFKPGFMASFLDFLKAGKKPELPADCDGCPQENLDTCCSLKGGIRPLSTSPSSLPSSPPPQPTGTFSDEGQGEGEELALSGCPSPCKPLDEELKGNLEALPSFSSDEEDSVSKNQDLQKSISSAISALYDTPHSLAAAMASAMMKAQPPLTPTTPQEPSLSPPLPARPPPIPDLKQTKEEILPIPPPSTTPPPSSSDQDQDPEAGQPSPSSPSSSSSSSQPPSPPTPEEAPASQRLTALHLAKKQADAAIAGESEEEDSESGGEGIFRERDEFVVRTEDIGTLKMALQTGREPPPIWRVQKALLQKFSPEIKDGQRQFCATSNYLGYFGDAKMRYQRLYVKFLENVNKKDYVRVCSRKPWHRAGLTLRYVSPAPSSSSWLPLIEQNERERQEKEKRKDREPTEEEKQSEQRENKRRETERENQSERERGDAGVELMRAKEEKREERKVESQSRSRMPRDKAEPPPKKRKKWLKEVPSSSSDSDSSMPSDDEGRCVWPLRALVNSRAMREMFRSYVEMLVSTALDPDMIQALEDTDDELYLPPMRKIDSLLSEQKKRLLGRVNMSSQHQEALQLFPKMTADPLESGAVRVHLGGEGYNRKTLNRVKKSISKQQDMKLSIETCRIYSLYHSLHHYKYHTFLHCKKETDSIEQAAEDPGQEEVVQQCMANQSWLESLFNSFVELLSLSCKA